MAERNVPLRSGRIRGHGVSPRTHVAQVVVEEWHRPPARPGQKRTPNPAIQSAMQRVRREAVIVRPPQSGAEGRVPLQSPSTRRANLRNARRKPTARGRNRRKALHGK